MELKGVNTMDKNNINKKIANLIIAKRNQNELSQKELAKKIGMATSVLAKIETSKRELRFCEFVELNNILNFNDIEIKELLNCKDNASKNILTIYQSYLKKNKVTISADEKKNLIEDISNLLTYINSL